MLHALRPLRLRRTRATTLTALVALAFAGGLGAACESTSEAPLPSVEAGTSPTPDASSSATVDAAKPAPAEACVDGKPGPYPAATGIDLSRVVPALSFTRPGGQKLELASYYEPCAPKSRLLVLRTIAGFCGPCQWSLEHTKDLIPNELADRVIVADLLVSDERNFPVVTGEDVARAASRLSGIEPLVAADPAYTFSPAGLADKRLPFFVMIDTRTMVLTQILVDPAPEDARFTFRQTFALLDKTTPPAPEALVAADGIFPRNHWEMLQKMRVPGAPPPDPTNAFADSASAASLGKKLFADKTLSPSGTVACATCHDKTKGFADGLPRGVGLAEGDRHTPSAALAAHAASQFWDGRADTLWLQALGPIENPIEMGGNRLHLAHKIRESYAADYASAFPGYPLPPLDDLARFPANGKPGDAAWTSMTQADRDAVDRVYVDVGKAIAAYERTIRVLPSALDRYAAGDFTALTRAQKLGLHTFFTAGCAQCHYGPRLTDDAFHVLRFETGRHDRKADRGAIDGFPQLFANPFRKAAATYYDAPPPALPFTAETVPPALLGAFKTPSLRGIAKRAPYGHGGTLPNVAELAKHYGNQGLPPADPRAVGTTETWVPRFLGQHADEIAELLRALDEDVTD